MVRAATLRSRAFSLAKAFSIGLKSGEYGGRYRIRAPAASIALAHAGAAMGGQIVHHDEVARDQRWHQHLLDIGQEGIAVHRAVEDHRRGQSTPAQCAGEGGGFPVSVWHGCTAALAAFGPAAQASHLGGGAGFVDEDQALRIQIRLRVDPCPAPRGDVGPLLLAGVRGFF